MRIALCDDDKSLVEKLRNEIYGYSNLHNWEPVIDVYYSGQTLVKTETKYDIIVLDYQMDDLDGIETAKILRQSINEFSCIIFLTSFPEVAIPAYKVDTYRFVEKSKLFDGLYEALDDYRNANTADYDISVRNEFGECVTINTSSIECIETQNRESKIYLTNNTIVTTRCALNKLCSKLPKTHFYRVHKAYVINFQHISQYDYSTIQVCTGKQIFISKNYSCEFKEKYKKYLRDCIK